MSRYTVLAAMSGGVDSAVAAALLHEQGHAIHGVTLRLACYGKTPMSPRACCTLDAIDDARRVATTLGFPYQVVDAEDVFKHRVMMPFVEDYASGRTPYPCALCNQHLKFGDLVTRMELVGADRLATGHYAQVRTEPDGSMGLYRAVDRTKDQTYALALIPYAVLSRVLFPLGALHKHAVREHGQRMGLTCWDKAESQDLCFVPDGDYAGYITHTLGETRGSQPGAFVDAAGHRMGMHRGVLHYTVGQRKGLGIAAPESLYVLAIDAVKNTVTVGPRHALEAPGLVTERFQWLTATPPAAGARATVRIRYNHAGADCRVHPLPDGRVELRFEQPQAAVTPGQLAVLYDGDRCLGGASIAHALGAPAPVVEAVSRA